MKRVLFALPLLALAACDGKTAYPSQVEKQAAELQASSNIPVGQIPVSSADTINGGKFQIVAPVEATVAKVSAFHPNPTVEQAQQKLRVEAAELGADAVINAQIGNVQVCPFSWACRVSTGTAVKLLP
jgi:hypothetical protein